MNSPLEIVVLAAGQGKRMYSARPKVLHEIAGRPLLAHVIHASRALGPQRIHIVYGHAGEQVRAAFDDQPDLVWHEQRAQLGTGDAVRSALPGIQEGSRVLVLYGDVPLIEAATLSALLDAAGDERLALLTTRLDDPTGYGRIVRDACGAVVSIVEERDANIEQRAIDEINTGILALPAHRLHPWLAALRNDNAQGEYYLTDIIAMAVADDVPVTTAHCTADEVCGINDRVQLAEAERRWQLRQAHRLMRAGVTLRDPARLDVRGELLHGRDAVLDIDVIIEGRVELGDDVTIGPYTILRNCRLGSGTTVASHSVIDGAELGCQCAVGPFARLRPGTRLADGVRIGNFVETKAANVGAGSKINHLSYIGDAEMGAHVNIGAGTITCNYDGANKHRTVIGDDAFIGSDSQLVAPVTIGPGATIGAGSTITRDAPAEVLTLSRTKQRTVAGWLRPEKKETR